MYSTPPMSNVPWPRIWTVVVATVTPPSPSLTRSLTVCVDVAEAGRIVGDIRADFVAARGAGAGFAEDVVAVEVPRERERIGRPGRIGAAAVERDRRVVERLVRTAGVGRRRHVVHGELNVTWVESPSSSLAVIVTVCVGALSRVVRPAPVAAAAGDRADRGRERDRVGRHVGVRAAIVRRAAPRSRSGSAERP